MKKISTVRAIILTILIAIPLAVSAQSSMDARQGFSNLGGLVTAFNNSIVTALITLFATAAMAAFFFGIVQFIWGSRDGNATKAANGKNFMLWGMIALFVMFSVWGIVQYTQNIFGIQGQNTIVIPSIKIQPGGTVTPSSEGNGFPSGTPTTGDCAGKTDGTACADYRGVCKNYSCSVNPADKCALLSGGTYNSTTNTCEGGL